MTTLYARAIWLLNCGRFTHISSDFGSRYYTHTFVTSEALYAALTRGATWRHVGRFVDLENDAQKDARERYFACDYDVDRKPIWFTPGLFLDDQEKPLAKRRGVIDRNDFNVITEGYPGTGGDGRPSSVPTYGSIEGILPGQRLLTLAFSPDREELNWFRTPQTFLLGKKRTMFQVVDLSAVVEGNRRHGRCVTGWLELPPAYGGDFQRFEVLAATMRYVILRGETRDEVDYIEFVLDEARFCLPDFYLKQIPGRSWAPR